MCKIIEIFRREGFLCLVHLTTLMVIIVLEAICCLYSVTLAYLSDKKFSKVLNLIMAAIWAIAALLNVVGF